MGPLSTSSFPSSLQLPSLQHPLLRCAPPWRLRTCTLPPHYQYLLGASGLRAERIAVHATSERLNRCRCFRHLCTTHAPPVIRECVQNPHVNQLPGRRGRLQQPLIQKLAAWLIVITPAHVQVYRARIRATGEEVAVKVQRPSALSTISKDLYVLRRGVKVYENLVKRFTAQTTDYQALLSTFAEGLYTEMDFRNEALNMLRMQELLDASEFDTAQVFIPEPRLELSSRRCDASR